ncbi:hypothetical protein EDD85DRAFT_789711 [Armillaria nabsnona]|nr:hypothetical protein EDD85DRAFT_789711 [Armillaria nabsnona]
MTLLPFFLTRLLYTTRRAPLVFPLPAILLLPVTYPSMITLYDPPFKGANSPGTDYQTVYVELPDIEALAKKTGASPTSTKPDGVSPFYTIPIIQDGSTGAVVSDSAAIAAYLDKTYPSSEPMLILTGTITLQLAFADAVNDAFNHLRSPLFYSDMAVKMNDRKTEVGSETCFADMTICASVFHEESGRKRRASSGTGITPWNDGDGESTLESFKPYEKFPAGKDGEYSVPFGDSFDKHDVVFLRRRLKANVLLTTTWW